MEPRHRAQAIASLRAITYRISSTPTKQLPNIAPHIAGSLWACRALLSTAPQTTKANSEAVTLVHRFRTSLSSLLQDRTIEGRWAGVVLVKATIEAGGVEVLGKAAPWIRSLLAILKKPEPPTTRNLAIVTLTRLFVLTWDHANLVREITTPNLPTFLSTCLSNVENRQRCPERELQTVLEAFVTLLPRHPTIFRTYEGQIRSLLLRILSATSSNNEIDMISTHTQKFVAQKLLVLLHHCAPKQGAADKWNETVVSTVASAHVTCDLLFRSVAENWSSTTGLQRSVDVSLLSAGELQFEGQDPLGLLPWRGIYAGGERLISLLGLLQRHLDTATAGSVTVPIGVIADLLMRVLSLTVPSSGTVESFKINNQISKDERETMFSLLPSCHVAALDLVNTMLIRLGPSVVSIVQALLDLVNNVFTQEKVYVDIRITTYRTIRTVLELSGPSMSREDVAELAPLVKACCDDLLPLDAKQTNITESQANGITSKPQPATAELITAKVTSSYPTQFYDLQREAKALLSVLFSKISPTHLPRKVRVQMERTAVLSSDREALIACVMSPAKKEGDAATQTSLLPLLAKLYPDSKELEAFLRPRMPVLSSKVDRVSSEFEASIAGEESVLNGGGDHDDMDLTADKQGSNEPTDDLLSALEQSNGGEISTANEDDLYAATPRSPSLPEQLANAGVRSNHTGSPSQDYPAMKRPAIEPLTESVSAKRLKASSVAAALESDIAESLPGAEVASIHTSLPVTVAIDPAAPRCGLPDQTSETATFPEHPMASHQVDSSMKGLEQIHEVQDNEDDSDFEIPPLNMEPDTDPEDDDDDNGAD